MLAVNKVISFADVHLQNFGSTEYLHNHVAINIPTQQFGFTLARFNIEQEQLYIIKIEA